ncbi:MAG: hypothetical protein U5S82_03975 [Gammaproteobacteria bacterium]|nr:hypothetical protein [Gammaproteobacteria bacterium]
MTIVVGSIGWDHDHWAGSFYPPDLPREWRLGYYANEFRAVLVPGHRFAATDVGQVESWLQDVPPGFAFWVEVAPAALVRVGPGLRALGPCLGGVVASSPPAPGWLDALGAWAAPRAVCAMPYTGGDGLPAGGPDAPAAAFICDAGGEVHQPCAVLRFPEAPSDNRHLAAHLQAFAAATEGRPALACFPASSRAPQSMAQVQIIIDLLGA